MTTKLYLAFAYIGIGMSFCLVTRAFGLPGYELILMWPFAMIALFMTVAAVAMAIAMPVIAVIVCVIALRDHLEKPINPYKEAQ